MKIYAEQATAYVQGGMDPDVTPEVRDQLVKAYARGGRSDLAVKMILGWVLHRPVLSQNEAMA